MDKTGFIYLLIDPRDKIGRYVGQTRNLPQSRLAHHWSSPTNGQMEIWFLDLRHHGLRPLLYVLEKPCVKRLNQRECYWIVALSTHKAPLLNVIDPVDRAFWMRQEPWDIPGDILVYTPESDHP